MAASLKSFIKSHKKFQELEKERENSYQEILQENGEMVTPPMGCQNYFEFRLLSKYPNSRASTIWMAFKLKQAKQKEWLIHG